MTSMAQVCMTEAELARDLPAALEKVRQGIEVAIEQGSRTIAVIMPVQEPGRSIDECIAFARTHGSGAVLDEDFTQDLQEIIARRKPLDVSAWD